MAWAGNTWWEPLGPFGLGNSDMEHHDEPVVRLGCSGVYAPTYSPSILGGNPEDTIVRLSDGTAIYRRGALGPGDSRVTQFIYRLATIDAANNVVGYTWSAAGEQLSVTDANGNTTGYGYDLLGRLVSQTDAHRVTSTLEYDGHGNLVRSTDGLGRTIAFVYDAQNHLVTETWRDANGTVTRDITRSYDDAGQLLQVKDADATYTMSYDGLGRVLTQDNAGTPDRSEEHTSELQSH